MTEPDKDALIRELAEALERFAYLDQTVPSDLWFIRKKSCEQAREALSRIPAELKGKL